MDQKEFGSYMTSIFQHGCMMMSVGLGHRMGLFKVLCEATEPLSVKDIADKLDFKERYTREWLSCMVAAGIIHQAADTHLYTVPDSHKPALNGGMAGFSPVLGYMGKKADHLIECFKKDGPWGLSFQDSPEWFDWFNDYRTGICDSTVHKEIIPLWGKQAGLIDRLEKGIKVLDVGCGPGNYTCVLAERFPNSTFTGLDFSEKAIGMANTTKIAKDLKNIEFIVENALDMPKDWTASFDMVFIYDVLHDLPNPQQCLTEVHRVLKDDGCLSLIEVGFHSDPVENAGNKGAAMYYTASMFICLSSSMSEEPHIGYGACWGVEEIQKTLKQHNFNIGGKSSLTVLGTKAFFYCTKG